MEMTAAADVTRWLQEYLRRQGRALNRQKSKVLLHVGFVPDLLFQEDQQIVLEGKRLTVAHEGMEVVGSVPIGTRDYQRHATSVTS